MTTVFSSDPVNRPLNTILDSNDFHTKKRTVASHLKRKDSHKCWVGGKSCPRPSKIIVENLREEQREKLVGLPERRQAFRNDHFFSLLAGGFPPVLWGLIHD